MSKFSLEKFLDKLCKEYPYLSNLGDILKKTNFYNVFKKTADFTFIVPKESAYKKLCSESGKTLKKEILKLFVSGFYTKPEKWDKTARLREGSLKVNVNKDRVELDNQIIVYDKIYSKIPVWKSTNKVHGGAFNSEKPMEESEMFDVEKWTAVHQYGLRKAVAKLYENVENKKVADCIINGHPLAEFFILYDSPFIQLSSMELDLESEPAESYETIMAKTGTYLVNNKDTEKIKEFCKWIMKSSILDDNIIVLHESFAEGTNKWENIEVIHPSIAPYFTRISLFVAVLDEIEKQMDSADSTYNHYIQAFQINKTSDLQTTYMQFIQENDLETVLKRLVQTFSVSGLILFKGLKEGSAEKKKKKNRKKITLKAIDRKKLSSQASKN
jgi:hypothetical protein